MEKYLGRAPEKHVEGLRYAKITGFPAYLLLVFKRFSNNGYTVEKDNSHLVYQPKLQISIQNTTANYRLLGQVCHEGEYETGKYRALVLMEHANKWYEVEDLHSVEVI